MRKLVVATWMSLDGIFDAETMSQWFNPYDSEARQTYIREGILAADAILFGRKTYEMLAPYWSSLKNNEMGIAGKLNSVAKYVVSATLQQATWENSTIIKENVMKAIAQLKQQPGSEIQVEGSATLVSGLAEAGLVDEYRFLVHPHIMGSGKRFFPEGQQQGLELVSAKTLDKGVIVLSYRPVKIK
ncbi:MAG TPA: dihydrofolate reductase family protein [Chitinophaga sp.]|uniref:dihydrofolate reductase family protein n=1 Tax=Chitinophaga sp. TaxID=1869181 RepID=UPI002DB9F264|nr:dihydrofolate reductase family protein [Chitinophaga sp.]HEU4555800.1 dihydrofolate reductase family protein [Chitinophaga sp.]